MKVCVLGDSHAAALKTGYELLEYDLKKKLQLTFFASRGGKLRALQANSGKLITRNKDVTRDMVHTSGGSSQVEPEAFDIFLIHAMGFRYHYFEFFNRDLYSSDFLAHLMISKWEASGNIYLQKELRKITNKKIVLSIQPFHSKSDRALAKRTASHKNATSDLSWILQLFSKQLDSSTAFLTQPAESIVEGVFTIEKYSTDSIRLDVGDDISGEKHLPTDITHMNALYGNLVWRSFINQMQL